MLLFQRRTCLAMELSNIYDQNFVIGKYHSPISSSPSFSLLRSITYVNHRLIRIPSIKRSPNLTRMACITLGSFLFFSFLFFSFLFFSFLFFYSYFSCCFAGNNMSTTPTDPAVVNNINLGNANFESDGSLPWIISCSNLWILRRGCT